VRLDLTGYADNKTALGVKVEVFANGHWQKWELAGASGYQTQNPPQILVGLGDAEGIDLLRICGRPASCRMRSICRIRK
jgi:hypothetical protein